MKKLDILLFSFLVILLSGCPMALETSDPSSSAKSALLKYGADKIIIDGKEMLSKIKLGEDRRISVPEEKWPESISAFRPKSVVAVSDRIYLVLNERGRHRNGVIIYMEIPERIKEDYEKGVTVISHGSGYGEYKMANGISWYHEKGRY